MPDGRPAIPAELKRRVLMEAGHRCAIPTCRTVPVEIAHIVAWSQVQEHRFENLIALCPTCHSRYDRGDIDGISMKGYKANLGIVTGRYGEIERRVLAVLAETPNMTSFRMPGGWSIQLMYLLKDGLIAPVQGRGRVLINGLPATEDYVVTPAGRDFISRWVESEPVSDEVGRVRITIRDGRVGSQVGPDGKGVVLGTIERVDFLDVGDGLTLPDGTGVVVIGVEETFGTNVATQTVFVGSMPKPSQ